MLVDVINDLDFPQNQELVRKSTLLGKRITTLKHRAGRSEFRPSTSTTIAAGGDPNFQEVVKYCLRNDFPSRAGQRRLRRAEAEAFSVLATPARIAAAIRGHQGGGSCGSHDECLRYDRRQRPLHPRRLLVAFDCVASLTAGAQPKCVEPALCHHEAFRTDSLQAANGIAS